MVDERDGCQSEPDGRAGEADRVPPEQVEVSDPADLRPDFLNPWALLLVLVFFAVGVGLVATRHWRRGSVMIGGSLVLAGLLRWVLPERLAGLLVVRSKVFDVVLGLGVGTAVAVLGMIVPGTFE
ncbi:MAG: DUF3017 domain-containing protein [Acidobacteriota bacterium]|nr:DUF3017 domain-containing protein [Acidobacteriota bacterium]NLH69439.1 DUF3017 domain-containing protein [Brooklawnia sp.]